MLLSICVSQQVLIYVDVLITPAMSEMNPTGGLKPNQSAPLYLISWKPISTGIIQLKPLWNLKAVADGSIFLASCSLEGDAGGGGLSPKMFSCVGLRVSLPSHKPSGSCQAGGGWEKMLFSWLVFIDMWGTCAQAGPRCWRRKMRGCFQKSSVRAHR